MTASQTDARVAPHNASAELAVLGSVVLDNDALLNSVVGQLQVADFYSARHRLIWGAILSLRSQLDSDGLPTGIDLVSLMEELNRQGQLDEAGGLAYLTGLAEGVPTAAYAENYARIVAEKAHLRRLIAHANEVQRHAYAQDIALEDIDALAAVPPIRQLAEQAVMGVGEGAELLLANLRAGVRRTFAPTGFRDLDEQIGGLEPGALYVLAARPAMGKSALAFQIAEQVARTQGRTLAYSLEMKELSISERLLCSAARVDLSRFKSAAKDGNPALLSDRDWQRLETAAASLRQTPLDIIRGDKVYLQDMLDEVRRQHRRDPVKLFVLDYLQLVELSGRAGENAVQRVSIISRALKTLAMELDIPVLALSQLSRAVEQRPNHRPMLSDLRESGAVEQDADTVMFIYRDEYYNRETDQQGIAEVIVGKQRNGPVGTVKLQFHSAHARFNDLTQRSY